MSDIALAYQNRDIHGWLGTTNPDLAAEQTAIAVAKMPQFKIVGSSVPTGKSMLYLICRKLLGKDTPNYPQKIGDCVSFGAKNAAEYLQCCDIVSRNAMEEWRPVFPPYFYGTGRVYVGKGQMDGNDGSSGSWMAQAVKEDGTLFADEAGVPAYSGDIAEQWGNSRYRSVLDKWKPTATNYLIKTTALISSWEDLTTALDNNFPCTTASDVGYNMEPSSDGFHRHTTNWSHQVCFIGHGTYPEPYAVILNNWADVHGHLKDFDDGHDLPVGVLRVRKADAMKHIAAGETFAYSNMHGFPATTIPHELFKIAGT